MASHRFTSLPSLFFLPILLLFRPAFLKVLYRNREITVQETLGSTNINKCLYFRINVHRGYSGRKFMLLFSNMLDHKILFLK